MIYTKTIKYVDYEMWDDVKNASQLAQNLGVTKSYLSKLRNGKIVASFSQYLKIKSAIQKLKENHKCETELVAKKSDVYDTEVKCKCECKRL